MPEGLLFNIVKNIGSFIPALYNVCDLVLKQIRFLIDGD